MNTLLWVYAQYLYAKDLPLGHVYSWDGARMTLSSWLCLPDCLPRRGSAHQYILISPQKPSKTMAEQLWSRDRSGVCRVIADSDNIVWSWQWLKPVHVDIRNKSLILSGNIANPMAQLLLLTSIFIRKIIKICECKLYWDFSYINRALMQ